MIRFMVHQYYTQTSAGIEWLVEMLRSPPVFALQIALIFTLIVQNPPSVLAQRKNSSLCTGIFDFYFVLDSSGSVEDRFHSQMIPFVKNITQHYAEPDFRMAIVTFATRPKVHLNLTRIADRDQIVAGMKSLSEHEVVGHTFLGPALSNVNRLVSTSGGDAASIVLVITDGKLQDIEMATNLSRILRSRGSTIFAIGVGKDVDFNQLSAVTKSMDRVHIGNDFSFLGQVLSEVVSETCVEITSATPSSVCLGTNTDVTLRGRGFIIELGRAMCRFKAADGQFYLTQPTKTVVYDTVICPVPQSINFTSTLLVQVTTNGVSYISSNVSLSLNSCRNNDINTANNETSGSDQGLIAGIVVLVLTLLVFLFLLWFFFPLITCKVKGGLPPEQKESQPKVRGRGTPGRTWEVVDTSYYGGRGAGGIRPMTVKWGEKGATLMGEKLEKAKDAKVITVKREPPKPPPLPPPPRRPPKGAGCCHTTKTKVARWYAVLASYRPVFTVNRNIVWCSKSKFASQNAAVQV